MDSHYAPTCPRCHAAQLIVDALNVVHTDDCRIRFAHVEECGTLYFECLSDDAGEYVATVTVEIKS